MHRLHMFVQTVLVFEGLVTLLTWKPLKRFIPMVLTGVPVQTSFVPIASATFITLKRRVYSFLIVGTLPFMILLSSEPPVLPATIFILAYIHGITMFGQVVRELELCWKGLATDGTLVGIPLLIMRALMCLERLGINIIFLADLTLMLCNTKVFQGDMLPHPACRGEWLLTHRALQIFCLDPSQDGFHFGLFKLLAGINPHFEDNFGELMVNL